MIEVANENQDYPADDKVATPDTDDVQTGHLKVFVRTHKAFSSSRFELLQKHLDQYIYSKDTLSKSEFSDYVS